ncbi:hypothetical protein D3C81_2238660 [compost metagenome]
MHEEACCLQPIDEPVPVERRLDHDTSELRLPWRQEGENLRQIVGQTLFRHDMVGFVDHGDHAVV